MTETNSIRVQDFMSDQILREIGEIKRIVGEHVIQTKIMIQQHSEKIEEHGKELWGGHGSPGLSKDVDRLKTIALTFRWQFVILIGLIGERVVSFLAGGKP